MGETLHALFVVRTHRPGNVHLIAFFFQGQGNFKQIRARPMQLPASDVHLVNTARKRQMFATGAK